MAKKKTNLKRSRAGNSGEAAAAARRRFIDAYITNGGNATNAAIQAGYSPKSATSKGSQLLREVNVSSALQARRAEINAALGLDAEETLRQARVIERANLNVFLDGKGRVLPPAEWPAEWRCAVQSYEWTRYGPKIKLFEKASARDLLAKNQGLLKEDNRQRTDPLTELLKQIGERKDGFRPGAYGGMSDERG